MKKQDKVEFIEASILMCEQELENQNSTCDKQVLKVIIAEWGTRLAELKNELGE